MTKNKKKKMKIANGKVEIIAEQNLPFISWFKFLQINLFRCIKYYNEINKKAD